MSRRFLVSIFLSDLASLAVALVVALWLVFGAYGPFGLTVPEGNSLWPFIGLMVVGAVLGSWVNRLAWGNAMPRPSYGRAAGIMAFAAAFTAIGLILTRAYWSRPFFALTVIIWFALALAHRAIRRRRPWTDQMVIVTTETQLVEDIENGGHAEVLAVLGPKISLQATRSLPGRPS